VDTHAPLTSEVPQMPNALPKMIEEERIVSFSIAHPGLGAAAGRRIEVVDDSDGA
jgi:hypothetical protein